MSFAREALRKPRSPMGRPDPSPFRIPRRRSAETLPDVIGAQLRRYYAGLLTEPIPPHLVDLLKQMDARKGET